MQLASTDHILKVVSMTRFHFVAGLPKAGARRLCAVLAQNPKFTVSSDSPAEQVFTLLNAASENSRLPLHGAGETTQAALLRGALDAVHHDRPMNAVVFDNNPDWLAHIEQLAGLFPLSRFLILVRDPARIAADMAEESGGAQRPSALMAKQGPIGAPIELLRGVLKSEAAKRICVVDYDRLLSDPNHVFDAIYGFLGETGFDHDFRGLPEVTAEPLAEAMRPMRKVVGPNQSGAHRDTSSNVPVWRRSQNSAATMILPEAG